MIRPLSVSASLAIAFAWCPVHAQPSIAQDIKDMCGPILTAAVTSQVNINRSIFSKNISKSWLCSQTFQSEEEASHSGVDVNAEFDGVRVGLLYSDNQQTRKSTRTQLCQGITATSDAAYKLVLTEVTRDALAYANYQSCVSNAVQSTNDLTCYFQANGSNQSWLTLNINYRPKTAKVGKYSAAPTLVGAKTSSGRPIFETLKSLQRQPFDKNKPIAPFSASIPVDRQGVGDGVFTLNLDDGTKCDAAFSAVPAMVDITIQPIGTALSRSEGRHSYHANEARNCGDDSKIVAFEERLPTGVVALQPQDLGAQIAPPQSSNCGRDASLIRDVVQTGADNFKVTYNIVGCGYDFFNACKGHGWINQYGFIRTRAIDPTQPLTVSHSEKRVFPSGRVEVYQAGFKQGLEPDFHLTDYFFTAEVSVPDETSPKKVRQFSLRGYSVNIGAPKNKYCEEWKNSKGAWTSVAALVGNNGVFTIVQDEVQCETLKNRVGLIAQNIGGVSAEEQCVTRRKQAESTLPKVPSAKLTAEQLFKAARCE